MTYDNWKSTNPQDEFLGPEPEEVMAEPVSRTTEEDDLLWRFLAAANERRNKFNGRCPLNPKEAAAGRET